MRRYGIGGLVFFKFTNNAFPFFNMHMQVNNGHGNAISKLLAHFNLKCVSKELISG